MITLSGQQIYDKLVKEDKIFDVNGQIRFYFGDVDIIVKQKDVVGNIVQEWLQGWLDKRGVYYSVNENTQMPPDFFLNPKSKKRDLLEVKAFYRESSPAFDIGDFRMYSEEIIDKPYMLDTDYLIFGYDMSKEGVVVIKDLWIKKVWQITRSMSNWPLNLQVKANVVHKIRPGIWYSNKNTKFPTFKRIEHFLSAMEETVYQNPRTHHEANKWKGKFLKSYENFYGVKLDIPRWSDISDYYMGK